MRGLLLLGVIFVVALPSMGGVPEGIAAMRRGDYRAAYAEFAPLAEESGDTQAITTIGLWFYEGTGFPQDYDVAMDWFIKAFKKGDGDAYNNIGVMYRDGLGVVQNRSIAYGLFLLAHLRGLGSESTQYRANRNLRREVSETTEEERALALCMTEPFLEAFVTSKGTLGTVPDRYLPTRRRHRIRDDKALWFASEQERMAFDCPEPWN